MAKFDLIPVIKRAIRLYDGPPDIFTSGAFAAEIRTEFDLAAMPDDAWCSKVLMDEDRVVRHRGPLTWRLLDRPIRRETLC